MQYNKSACKHSRYQLAPVILRAVTFPLLRQFGFCLCRENFYYLLKQIVCSYVYSHSTPQRLSIMQITPWINTKATFYPGTYHASGAAGGNQFFINYISNIKLYFKKAILDPPHNSGARTTSSSHLTIVGYRVKSVL